MLRKLFVKIGLDSGDTNDRLKELSKQVEKAKEDFQRFGNVGQSQFTNLAKVANLPTDAVTKLIQKTKEDMKLDEQFRAAAAAAGLTKAEIDKVKSSIDRAKESAASWKGVMGGLASAGITGLAGLFVGSGIKAAAEAENMAVQFEVLMGSAEGAKKTLAELAVFAESTNFESFQIEKAGRQLLAVGIDADTLTDKLRMIGDVANGSGKDFNELATIFAKNKSSNFIQGDDLNQMIEAGIPILDEFGKMFGKTALQVKEMGSKNQIEFKHLEQAMLNMTTGTGKYANMTKRLSEESLGMFSTLVDKVKSVGKNIGIGILGFARPILQFFTQGEQAGARLNIALGAMGVLVGVLLVNATMAWAASLDVVTISAVKAYAALVLPAVILAAKLLAVYLVLEDIYVFFEYGPAMSETYFGDLLSSLGLTQAELQSLSDGFQYMKSIFMDAWSVISEALKSPSFKIALALIAFGILAIVAPILLVTVALFALKVALVVAIVAGIAFVIARWGDMTRWMKDAFAATVQFLKRAAILTGKIIISAMFPIAGLYIFRKEILAVFKAVWDYIKDFPIVQKFVEQFLSLKDKLSGVFSGMWDSLKSIFTSLLPTGAINLLIEGINFVIEKLNSFSNSPVIKALGISPMNLSLIPKIEPRAEGGPVLGGNLYRINERKEEYFQPNQNGHVHASKPSSSGGSSPIIINVNVTMNSSNAKEFATDLYDELNEAFKQNINPFKVALNMEPA